MEAYDPRSSAALRRKFASNSPLQRRSSATGAHKVLLDGIAYEKKQGCQNAQGKHTTFDSFLVSQLRELDAQSSLTGNELEKAKEYTTWYPQQRRLYLASLTEQLQKRLDQLSLASQATAGAVHAAPLDASPSEAHDADGSVSAGNAAASTSSEPSSQPGTAHEKPASLPSAAAPNSTSAPPLLPAGSTASRPRSLPTWQRNAPLDWGNVRNGESAKGLESDMLLNAESVSSQQRRARLQHLQEQQSQVPVDPQVAIISTGGQHRQNTLPRSAADKLSSVPPASRDPAHHLPHSWTSAGKSSTGRTILPTNAPVVTSAKAARDLWPQSNEGSLRNADPSLYGATVRPQVSQPASQPSNAPEAGTAEMQGQPVTARQKLASPEAPGPGTNLGLTAESQDKFLRAPSSKLSANPPMICFDLETLDGGASRHYITEIAAVCGNREYSTLVNIGHRTVSAAITAYTNITNDMVHDPTLPTLRPALEGFLQFVEDVSQGEAPLLVAHNGVSFDIRVTLEWCFRVGLPFPVHWHYLDSLGLARLAYKDEKGQPGGPERFSQPYLREYYGIPATTAHRALADSQVLQAMTARLLEKAYTNPGIDSLETLMRKLNRSAGRISESTPGIVYQERLQGGTAWTNAKKHSGDRPTYPPVSTNRSSGNAHKLTHNAQAAYGRVAGKLAGSLEIQSALSRQPLQGQPWNAGTDEDHSHAYAAEHVSDLREPAGHHHTDSASSLVTHQQDAVLQTRRPPARGAGSISSKPATEAAASQEPARQQLRMGLSPVQIPTDCEADELTVHHGAIMDHLKAWQEVMADASLVRPVLGMQVRQARKLLTESQRKQLIEAEFELLADVLQHYPRDYKDFSSVPVPGQDVTLYGTVMQCHHIPGWRASRLETIVKVDQPAHNSSQDESQAEHGEPEGQPEDPPGPEIGFVLVRSWRQGSKGSWIVQQMAKEFPEGTAVVITGQLPLEPNSEGFWQMSDKTNIASLGGQSSSDTEDQQPVLTQGMIVPVYPARTPVNPDLWPRIHARLLEALLPIHAEELDLLPADIRNAHGCMSFQEAVRAMHEPHDLEWQEAARCRLAFEELFLLQSKLLLQREILRAPRSAADMEGICIQGLDLMQEGLRRLPFQLTNAQDSALSEILADLATPVPMMRLLQGDVGSGKTAVAFLALLAAADSGYQSVLMAPTEVLADQHLANLEKLVEGMPSSMQPKLGLLKSSMKAKAKAAVKEGLASGNIVIAIGTHSLISDGIDFQNLGLAIVDEQHRFGVEQRSKLYGKANPIPHVLTMTATPIPRTLALVAHGDMALSALNELPPGRIPTDTLVLKDNATTRRKVTKAIQEEVAKDGRVFIICPLREESQAEGMAAVKAAEGVFRELQESGELGEGVSAGLLHGKMPGEEKTAALQAFSSGKTPVLVSTSVVEVGVDVPAASVMVVWDADRFGLAQLHQFRGRVGRGTQASTCFLVTRAGPLALNRLSIMERSHDGFEIAEVDLEHRGHGDLLGKRQSGRDDLMGLRAARLPGDKDILELARRAAATFLSSTGVDPSNWPHALLAALRERALPDLDIHSIPSFALDSEQEPPKP